MSTIYVSGHRNPDTDSIASAIAYAELCARLDTAHTYEAVRLGELNAQSRWVLERAGAQEPELLEHVMLRVRDVMQRDFYVAGSDDSVRDVGLAMAQRRLDVVPIVDDEKRLVGVLTERALARRYIRESREASTLVDTPTRVTAIASAVEGETLVSDGALVSGRVWVFAMDSRWADSGIGAGDVVVVGNREDAQRRALEAGVALLIVSNGVSPAETILEEARARGTSVISSPLDSYVCGRMTTLSAPCSVLMDREPLQVRGDDLVADVTELIKDVHYRAAVSVDHRGRPEGLVTRSDLVNPTPRDVILVDHAESAQSVPGVEQAHIVEIVDHHHIGSIETRLPVRATFDPVGSTSTLVVERFRHAGEVPSVAASTMLLGGILSDTVILTSPTTTPRDREAAAYLATLVEIDVETFGREMFENGSDVREATAEELVRHDAKGYELGSGTMVISQLEVVGSVLDDRIPELLDALRDAQAAEGHVLRALMLTDIIAQETRLLLAGDTAAVGRALQQDVDSGVVRMPGVMSRKKQVAPLLLGAF